MTSPSVVHLPWLPTATQDFGARCRAVGVDGNPAGPALQTLAGFRLSANQAVAVQRALKRCRSGNVDLAPLLGFRLGLLTNATFDLLNDQLPAGAARHGVALELVTTPYDQVMQQALDPTSEINRSTLDAVLVAVDHRWLNLDRVKLGEKPEERVSAALQRLRAVVDGLRDNGRTPAILQTVPTPPQSLFGSYDRFVSATLRTMIDDANRGITAMASETGSYLLDVAALAERVGSDRWFDPVRWVAYKLPFEAECFGIYADMLGRLLGAIRGKARKCLVLDLDNTVWGGVIGDHGLEGIYVGQGNPKGEAFLSVQQAALELRERGIMLAASSKNTDKVARLPFREHPDMLLREKHFSVFQANWIDKPSNLEAIAKSLNIGLDSLVLLDDNPAERAQVRAALPMVAVPELPDDPSWFAWHLLAAGYFEAIGFSAEDRLRAESYATDAKRADVMAKARDLGDYLSSLDMTITFAAFDKRGRQRIAQLINKTNQFNLTTRRYTEADVATFEDDESIFTLQVRLEDKFGDLGMIGMVICRTLENEQAWDIDTWLMSCRVLGRGVEQAMLSKVAAEAGRRGVSKLLGQYIPTAKNSMVSDHYQKLGFAQIDGSGEPGTRWALTLADYSQPSLAMRVAGEEVGTVQGSRMNSPPMLETDRFKSLLAELPHCLSSGDADRIGKLVREMCEFPMELEAQYDRVLAAFRASSRVPLMVDLLLGARDKSFTHLRLIARILKTAQSLDREREVLAIASEVSSNPNSPPVRWSYTDQINRVKQLGKNGVKAMRLLKYRGDKVVPERLFQCARRVAGSIDLPQAMLDRLYAASRHGSPSRAEWENDVRSAFAIDHITKDFMSTNEGEHLARWLGGGEALEILGKRITDPFREVDQSKGTLVVTFHGGFSRLSLALYQHLFKDGMILTGGIGRRKPAANAGSGKAKNYNNAKFIFPPGNERAALFQAVRAMQDGGMLRMGADAPFGNRKTSIEVVGVTIPVAEGATFIAYETRCNTVWLSLVREGEGFAPVVARGPVREPNEKFGDFKDRWLDFYRGRIEDFLTGDPRNLALRPHLVNYLTNPVARSEDFSAIGG